MKRTGKFLTSIELQTIPMPPHSCPVEFQALEFREVYEKIYNYALSKRLPEIKGWYGVDSKTGEIVSMI